MKPYIMTDYVNYSMPVYAKYLATGENATATGFLVNNLSQDYGTWRSTNKNDLGITFTSIEKSSVNCCVVFGANLPTSASVFLSGSNSTSPNAFFTETLFRVELKYAGGKWYYLGETDLPETQFFRLEILNAGLFDNSFDYITDKSRESFISLDKVYIGKAEEMALDVLDGSLSMSSESFQKRDVNNGQWNTGSKKPNLKSIPLEFRPVALGSKIESEVEAYNSMIEFIEYVQTSMPFVFIIGLDRGDIFLEYVTIDGDSISIDHSEADEVVFAFDLKETR